MFDNEKIVNDFGEGHKESAWLKYVIKWSGDCLIAELLESSPNAESPTAFHYLNNAFKSKQYEKIGSIENV